MAVPNLRRSLICAVSAPDAAAPEEAAPPAEAAAAAAPVEIPQIADLDTFPLIDNQVGLRMRYTSHTLHA